MLPESGSRGDLTCDMPIDRAAGPMTAWFLAPVGSYGGAKKRGSDFLSHALSPGAAHDCQALGWPLGAQVAVRLSPLPWGQAARPLPVGPRGACASPRRTGIWILPSPR